MFRPHFVAACGSLRLAMFVVVAGLAVRTLGHDLACTGSPRRPNSGPPVALPREPYRSFEGDLSGPEQRLFDDAADGRLDQLTLLAAGLIASNVTRPERLDRCEAHLSEWVRRLKESGCTAGPARQRAEAVFEFLHREVLRGGYRVEDTNVAAVFDEGRFNCVTASLLFHCLAERCGLVVYGVEMPGPAMSRVLLPEGPLDVETTCPQWFRVTEDRRKAADAVVKAAGGAPHSAHAAREVTGIELVAMVYYNRGIDLLRQKRFAEALAVNAKALRLDPASAAARANLLATLNNWAIHLATEGQFSEAAILMRRGLALDAAHGPLRANYAYLCRQWREAPALPAP